MTLAFLALYYLLRLVASNCSGAGCHWFIPFSLLLPLLVLTLVAITGVQAVLRTWKRSEDRPWTLVLAGLTVVSVAGPIIALAVFRDSPDRFVPTATVLVILLPLTALIYSFRPEHG